MKALTIRQPWADAIVHGTKRTENRTWRAPTKHIGTRILIHAAAGEDRAARSSHETPAELTSNLLEWPGARSAIIAVATLTGSHFDTGCCYPWGQREVYHWRLADILTLPEPVTCTGRLSFWTPPKAALAAVRTQIEAVTA
ncbi:MAG TPA: hypothetical protein DEQ61_08350 [Streptomyces sp.]|nr:hypothetical protein [Streptomyces sp.]